MNRTGPTYGGSEPAGEPRFADLLCADEQWVAAEFAAIVAANFPTERVPAVSASSAPARPSFRRARLGAPSGTGDPPSHRGLRAPAGPSRPYSPTRLVKPAGRGARSPPLAEPRAAFQ